MAALSTIAEIWKQTKCPSVYEWIKMLSHIYIVEYYPAIKKKEILSIVTIWMSLDSITLSEISQSEKNNYNMISLICGIQWIKWTNKQNTDSLIETWLTAVGRWGDGWMEGLSKKEKKRKNSWKLITVGWLLGGRVERGGGCYGGINGNGQRLDLGYWIYSTVYRWCVVEMCAWNLYNFLTCITPINSIKRGE